MKRMKNATFLWSFGNIQSRIQPHPQKIGLVPWKFNGQEEEEEEEKSKSIDLVA
jgi:hypothetical protein